MNVCLISKKSELKCGKISDAAERKVNHQIGQFESLWLKITFLEKLNKQQLIIVVLVHYMVIF